MNSSVEVALHIENEEVKEIIIAELADVGFYGFQEDEFELRAFAYEQEFNENHLNELLSKFQLTCSISTIKSKNWNEMWESSFSPVQVDDFCMIRADFHSGATGVTYDIIITPKMSFGTGHHATTYLMVKQMQHLHLENKSVADFGTGTGILAILAEKLGSDYILAIDNDDWSIENARENLQRNGCSRIALQQASSFEPNEKFDVVLANINRNVILSNFGGLVFGLKESGKLLLSGILQKDENEILVVAARHNLSHINTVERDTWISILLQLR